MVKWVWIVHWIEGALRHRVEIHRIHLTLRIVRMVVSLKVTTTTVAMHGRALVSLFSFLVASLALILCILLGMRRSSTAGNAHEVPRVWAHCHHATLLQMAMSINAMIGTSTHGMMY